jgi:O-methyltransferase
MLRLLMRAHLVLTVPVSILFIMNSKTIHPSYKITLYKKLKLGFTMFLNKLRVPMGTSYKSHLAMALKILETSPDVPGDIVECGTWKGGSATNLSLVCKIVGRKLRVYDSFEGLPEGEPTDREASGYEKGDYKGTLDEVKSNISRYGSIESCEFIKGWFNETLPKMNSPVLLAFLDVDLEASLDTCVKNIWPHLVERGYIFTDECAGTNYTSLFYSEKWWAKHFDRFPPGLIGAGTGLPLGEYYIGPWSEIEDHPLQHASTGAYTMKNMSGYWSYYPDEI